MAQPTIKFREELNHDVEVIMEVPRHFRGTLFVKVYLQKKQMISKNISNKKKHLAKSTIKGKEKVKEVLSEESSVLLRQ